MQRNFAVFGGEFLMKQNVKGLRGFFDGFFKLPLEYWGGFLAGWPGLPWNEYHESWLARLWYGLSFVVRLPPVVALDMAASIAAYTITEGVPLPQSVTPFLGKPASYEYERNKDTIGDVAVKEEARRMIQESKVTEDLPVAFEAEKSSAELPKGEAESSVSATIEEKVSEKAPVP
jgi:lycopene beta-cyclase